MQVDIALDPLTDDLIYPIRQITGAELIQQRIRLRLRRGLGEWFADTTVGLPLLEWFEQKPPDLTQISVRIQQEILEVPGVKDARQFTAVFDAASRQITIEGTVIYDSGEATTVAVQTTDSVAGNEAYLGVFFRSSRIAGGPPAPSTWRP